MREVLERLDSGGFDLPLLAFHLGLLQDEAVGKSLLLLRELILDFGIEPFGQGDARNQDTVEIDPVTPHVIARLRVDPGGEVRLADDAQVVGFELPDDMTNRGNHIGPDDGLPVAWADRPVQHRQVRRARREAGGHVERNL